MNDCLHWQSTPIFIFCRNEVDISRINNLRKYFRRTKEAPGIAKACKRLYIPSEDDFLPQPVDVWEPFLEQQVKNYIMY